jgi:hypothetical protein
VPGELLAMIESDLADTLASHSEFASAVTLIDPNGLIYAGWGRVTHDYVVQGEMGERIVVNEPCVIIRKSDWARIPMASENWKIASPTLPTNKSFMLNSVRAPEYANTIGFVRLFPQVVSQSVLPPGPSPVGGAALWSLLVPAGAPGDRRVGDSWFVPESRP